MTLGQMRRLKPKIEAIAAIGAEMGEEQVDAICEVVAAALGRNYPDMTAERVADMLDLGNAQLVFRAILGGSGLREVRPGEAAAVATSTISTAFSPPPAAIP
jgi:hypothetical protein